VGIDHVLIYFSQSNSALIIVNSKLYKIMVRPLSSPIVNLLLPYSQKKICQFRFVISQTFSTSTKFIEKLSIVMTSNRYLINIDLMVNLRKLISYIAFYNLDNFFIILIDSFLKKV
jgi:hypothetical protein